MAFLPELIGESPGIIAVRETIKRLLQRQTEARRLPPILLQGETGTGKGLLARAIHRSGPRAAGPFVDVNCAAIPETLLEAELFGFERGAFTDARQAKAGLFQTANRGTIFLDEIGLLSEGLQAKLLNVIEERAVRRLGSTRSEPVDVSIVTASNEHLEAATRQRRFREDLYHRLAVLTLWLPPLRERREDILVLAEHFLAGSCADYNLPPKALTPDARAALVAYPWPGNVRELANVIERVALLSEGPLVTSEILGLPESPPQGRAGGGVEQAIPLQDAVGSVEQTHILEALSQTGWNISRAATRLGIPRNTLRYRIEKYGLRPGTSPAPPRRPRAERPAVPTPVAPGTSPPSGAATPVGIRWERQHVTLLRARLIAPAAVDSPLDASRALAVLVEKVQSFGGVVEEASPTGLLAAFGLEPVEDAPRRAALAAMAIQKAFEHARQDGAERFRVTVEIHVGRFLVGRVSGTATIDLEAKREAWSVLEELGGSAEPDQILVSRAARPFLQRRFDLVPLNAGGSAESHAYRLAGRELPGLGIGGRMARFVGRRDEFELLRSRLAFVMAGHGQVVGIAGEAGIGKSRLLFEIRESLAEERVTYLAGHCLSHGSMIPYLPVLEMLRSSCRLAETDRPEAVSEKLRLSLERLGIDPNEAAPYLLHLLGVNEGTDQLSPLSPEAIKTRTFEILRQMSLREARQRPLILTVEDLQWIDKTSEEYFASLVETLAGAPILFLATYRPGYRPPWMEKSYATQVALQPLSPEDSLTVVHTVLQGEHLPAPIAQMIVEKAEGNPFFLEELARAIGEQGELRSTLAVPDTIQEVLLARINRLPEQPKRLLQTASILGREFSLRLLGAISVGSSDLGSHLSELMRLEFLYEQSEGEEPVFVFKHALTTEVAYESLPTSVRQALHAAAGRALENLYAGRLEEVYDGLSYHYSKAEEAGKAVDYLARVARKAARGHSHVEAIAALEKALVHVERLPAEERDRRFLDLILRLAYSLYFVGRFREGLELLLQQQEPLERLGDPSLAGRYYFWLGLTYSVTGDHKMAAQNVERALAEAKQCGDTATMGRAHCELARESFWSGRPLQGLDHGRNAVALLEPTEERGWLGMAHWVVGINYGLLGDFEPALHALAQAQAIAEVIGDARLQSMATWTMGGMYATSGECEAGIDASQRALKRSPDPLSTAQALGWVGYAYLENQDPTQAVPLLEQAVEQLRRFRFRQLEGWFTAWLSEAVLLNGQIEKALQLASQALEITRPVKDWFGVGSAQRALGRIAQASGKLSQAEMHLKEAFETFASIPARFEVGRTHLCLAEVAHAQGNREVVATSLRKADELFRALRVPKYVERTGQLAREFGVPPFEGTTRSGDDTGHD